MRRTAIFLAALLAIAVAAGAYHFYMRVQITDYPKPVRIDSQPDHRAAQSVVVASIGVPLASLKRGLERDVPRRLWSIDRKLDECVPRKDVRVLGRDITQTPRIGCRIVGHARRGAITLRGRGDTLVARFPVTATVRAEDVGGIIKRETATGSAIVEVSARFSIGSDWRPKSDVGLTYRWAREPGIDFLGQRISFTDRADKELRGIIDGIERSLQRQLSRIHIRSDVTQLWEQGFTVLSLNRENPPVWLRMTPQNAGIGRFRVSGGRLSADVMLAAQTEIIVGEQPARPPATPLGGNVPVARESGFSAVLPVLADYAQIEPVILRKLHKLAQKGIEKEGLGRLEVEFEDVTMFATQGGKIAVGVTATVEPVGNRTGRIWGASNGLIWLVGKPVTEAGSEIVGIEDLRIYGDMDKATGDLLIRVMAGEDVRRAIQNALVEDFRKDYDDIVKQARAGIETVTVGEITLNFDIASIEHGEIQVTGKGLFMPIEAKGTARARLHGR